MDDHSRSKYAAHEWISAWVRPWSVYVVVMLDTCEAQLVLEGPEKMCAGRSTFWLEGAYKEAILAAAVARARNTMVQIAETYMKENIPGW